MNAPECDEYEYTDFLTASPKVFSCSEAGKVQPVGENVPSHDSVNRPLYRLPSDPEVLRRESARFTDMRDGVPISDDPASDKPYAEKIQTVTYHRSGKHHGVVKGINLVTLLRTDGDPHIPCDYRIYCEEDDGRTENDHFKEMLHKAEEHGACPGYVLSDSRYAGPGNLKSVREPGRQRFAGLKGNRPVNPDGSGTVPLSEAGISESGTAVHPEGYGFIRVSGTVAGDGSTGYRATSDSDADDLRRVRLSDFSWKIGEYHHGLRQFRGAERSSVRPAEAQRNHIGPAIRAFLGSETAGLKTGISRSEAEMRIIRDAVRAYLADPVYASDSAA